MAIMISGVNNISKHNTAYRIQYVKAEILANTLALILYAWFIIDTMHYLTIWYIWIVFNLLPFAAEVTLLVINLVHYRKYDKVYE
jgi:hypothetical protein